MNTTSNQSGRDANEDPITGAPGSHPVGTGLGAAGAGAAGAAIGAVGGPIGAVVGGAVGAIIGGLGGKAIAENIDPTVEDAYWRENHRNQDFARGADDYDAYAPAYRTGYSSVGRYGPDATFEDSEASLRADYEREFGTVGNGDGHLSWEEAKAATRAAWNRVRNEARANNPNRR